MVTTYEKDNPIPNVPEIFVDNPLCPINPLSFWSIILNGQVSKNNQLAFSLTAKVTAFYRLWNLKYCKGDYLLNVGLHNEPYFKYFSYLDFLTPYSGLIQIRKYAENDGLEDLLTLFSEIQSLTKQVRDEMYRLLVDEFNYFE